MDLIMLLILKWQNKIPLWVKWILFLPISALVTTILFFPFSLIALLLGVPEGLIKTIYAIIWQINFLVLVFYTVPKKQIQCLLILTSLRTSFLILFIIGLVISLFDPALDFLDFREFVAEVLVLLGSLYLIKIYKDFKPTEKEGLLTIKYSLGFALFIIISLLIDRALTYLSNIPYIGWFFRYIKHMRDKVVG